jgi:hypothetical protein
LDDFKIENFCASKDNIKRVKRQPRKEKILENYISDSGLVSRTYKELLQLNNHPIKSWTTARCE